VLRLEETTRPTTGTDGNGRRFTVTAIGSRVSVDHRGSTIVSASMAAGDSLAVPLAVEQGASADSRKSSKASSDTAAEDDLEVVVPARTFTNSLYQPNLEAIEERRLSPRPGSLSSGLSGKSS
jgi:ABC-type Fe3+-hydroxamate transport system substrate-binding protein